MTRKVITFYLLGLLGQFGYVDWSVSKDTLKGICKAI